MQNWKLINEDLTHKWILLVLLAAFIIVAVAYSVSIPPGEGVDEAAHFDYVRFVKEQHVLPVQPMTPEQEVVVWMGHHPPLYYALGALIVAWTDTSDFSERFLPNPHFIWQENNGLNGWNAMMHFGQDRFPWQGSVMSLQVLRLFNVILATIALYAIYRAAELMFPNHPWVSMGATAVVAFNPSFIYMSSTIHHDVLQATIFALAMWWIIRYLDKPPRSYDGGLAGLLVGSAMLTKLSGLVLAIVIGLALLIQALRQRKWRRIAMQTLAVYGIAIIMAGWWYVRNWVLYDDPFGWQMFLSIHRHMIRPAAYTWDKFTNEFLAQIGRTFWGGFGFMHITFPETTKYLWWLVGLALVGLLIAVYRKQLALRRQWAHWLVLLAVLFLLFISFVRFSAATLGAGHGRYLFPAAFSIGVLIVVGLNGFTAWKHERTLSLTLAVGMFFYAIWLPAMLVLPKYAPPAVATEAELLRSNTTEQELSSGVFLVGYMLGVDRVVPGGMLPVRLYWQVRGDPVERQDPMVRLELIDEKGTVLDSITTWPVPALAPEVWLNTEVYVTETSLKMHTAEQVDKVSLTVTPIEGADMDIEKTPFAEEPIRLTEILTTGNLTQVGVDEAPHDRLEVIDNRLAFLGYEPLPGVVSPGDALMVELYWQVLEEPKVNYTTFVHLLDDRGELVTQYDRQAGGDQSPSSTWTEGQILRDVYPLFIPKETAPGAYTLVIGMYTWPTLERLPVTINSISAGESIELGHLNVSPQ